MISIEHTKSRLLATKNAQVLITALWLWAEKTLQEWTDDIAAIDLLEKDERAKRTDWRNAAILWDADLERAQVITRALLRKCRYKYRNDAGKKRLFRNLRTDARSRPAMYDQGTDARDAWQAADATLKIKLGNTEVSLGEFSALLAASLTRKEVHGAKFAAWRLAAGTLMNKVANVDVDNMAWYAEATGQFGPATPQGAMIRSTVPTTTRPEEAVGQAVLAPPTVTGNTVQLQAAAEHATRFTYLHQAPGSAVFLVLVSDSPDATLTLEHLAAGVHRFKAAGSNSRGDGEESAVVEVTVAAQAVA